MLRDLHVVGLCNWNWSVSELANSSVRDYDHDHGEAKDHTVARIVASTRPAKLGSREVVT